MGISGVICIFHPQITSVLNVWSYSNLIRFDIANKKRGKEGSLNGDVTFCLSSYVCIHYNVEI